MFERIYPFTNGTERIGRLIMVYQAIQNNIVPPLIKNENRDKYLTDINDKDNLYQFLKDSIDKSLEWATTAYILLYLYWDIFLANFLHYWIVSLIYYLIGYITRTIKTLYKQQKNLLVLVCLILHRSYLHLLYDI